MKTAGQRIFEMLAAFEAAERELLRRRAANPGCDDPTRECAANTEPYDFGEDTPAMGMTPLEDVLLDLGDWD